MIDVAAGRSQRETVAEVPAPPNAGNQNSGESAGVATGVDVIQNAYLVRWNHADIGILICGLAVNVAEAGIPQPDSPPVIGIVIEMSRASAGAHNIRGKDLPRRPAAGLSDQHAAPQGCGQILDLRAISATCLLGKRSHRVRRKVAVVRLRIGFNSRDAPFAAGGALGLPQAKMRPPYRILGQKFDT